MRLSTMMTVSLYLLFHRRVTSSASLPSKNRTLLKGSEFENVLEIFLADLKKGFLDKYVPRHVTIVGGSRDDLQQAQSLFGSYPFIICEESIKCGYSKNFSQGNFVIIFLEDLSNDTIVKIIDFLSNCRKCKVLFMFNGIIGINDVWFIFNTALEHNVAFSEVAHRQKDSIELYSNFVATNCSLGARLVSVWRSGTSLKAIENWAFQSPRMNGCPVSISSLTFTPKMIIEEKENGSLTIVGGREGKLVLTLADRLNFSIALRYPSVADQLKFSRKVSIMNDVASGISEIGIGRLRPANNLNYTIIVSVPYDRECITWGVPRVMNFSNDIVWVEFSWEVWASIGMIFGITCVVGYAHQNHVSSMNEPRTKPGFLTIFLDVIAIHLGNPVVHVSSSPGGRFMLTAIVFYAMVITTAYKSSLASILATDSGTPTIVDAQGIINANLNIGGSLYDYNILQDQANESKVSSILLERFVINNNDAENWRHFMSSSNYAFMGRRSVMDHDRQAIIRAHKPINFDVLSDCILAYHAVIAFQKRSFLRKPSDEIIQRLTESGILNHWDIDELNTDKILQRKSLQKYYDKRAAYKFWNIFRLYFFCISVSLLFFCLELLAPKIDPRNRRSA